MAAKWLRKGRRLLAWAGNHHELRQLCQLVWFAPLAQFGHVVRADEIEQFHSRKSLRIITKRVNGVGNAAAPDFLLVNFAIRPARERQAQQLQSRVCGRGLAFRFERRLRSRDEIQSVQPQFFNRRLRHQQVAQVDRVERTAKQTDFQFRVQSSEFSVAKSEAISNTELQTVNRFCHNCGEPWTLDGQPGRGETCMKCRADLRVCLNCAFYDPHVAQQCRERRAEPVLEKDVGNFCEFFEFAFRDWKPKTGTNKREADAREQLKKLFGD